MYSFVNKYDVVAPTLDNFPHNEIASCRISGTLKFGALVTNKAGLGAALI